MAWHGIGILEILGIHGASNRSSRSNTQELDERESRPSAFAYTEDAAGTGEAGHIHASMTMFNHQRQREAKRVRKDDCIRWAQDEPGRAAESGFQKTKNGRPTRQNPGNPLIGTSPIISNLVCT
ncbi:hypothetical protein CSOJ01_04998 [Colletotrichum sojae]|uniref:Uncharacterized protein n=1 Tax=Colletotrichum sojae TaxID=2175907 RepID=A0A8H6MXJ6_9PEZI|nr:hypothetical protein CSOJ01_04998 [Colletotrichum sojae]